MNVHSANDCARSEVYWMAIRDDADIVLAVT
jgi:hypothetical protein